MRRRFFFLAPFLLLGFLGLIAMVLVPKYWPLT